MRKFVLVGFVLAATAAYGENSAVPSDVAGNILNGSPELANQLPTPAPGADTVAALLADASTSLQAGRTGEAQEALEQAETRALDRSVPQSAGDNAISDPLVNDIYLARQALGAKNIPGALQSINAARTWQVATNGPQA